MSTENQKQKVIVLDTSDSSHFESELSKYLEMGYTLKTSSSGFVNSEEYDFCLSFQAVLVLETESESDLRDKFAMAALASFLETEYEDVGYGLMAANAYQLADAMLEARKLQ